MQGEIYHENAYYDFAGCSDDGAFEYLHGACFGRKHRCSRPERIYGEGMAGKWRVLLSARWAAAAKDLTSQTSMVKLSLQVNNTVQD